MTRDPTRKLQLIAVLFRNGHDDGFGLRFSAHTTPTAAEVDAAIVEALPRMRAIADPPLIQAALAHMRHLAKLTKVGELSADEALAAAVDIAWLTEAGVIVDGEYDGIVYLDTSGAVIARPPPGTVH